MLCVHSVTMAPTDEPTWFHLYGANRPLWRCVEASAHHSSHVIPVDDSRDDAARLLPRLCWHAGSSMLRYAM